VKKTELISIIVIISAVALFVVFYLVPRMTADVQFSAEKVTLTVQKTAQGHNLEVQGYYFFDNPHPFTLTKPIFFPVQLEYGQVMPESVLVTDATGLPDGDWEIVRGFNVFPHSLDAGNSRFFFQFRFPRERTSIMACRYFQKLDSNEFGYIVTTIRDWGIPLKSARFEIRLPDGYTLGESNYEFKLIEDPKSQNETDYSVWRFDTTEFLPDQDIKVSFKAPN
jgi:hypothetical protein